MPNWVYNGLTIEGNPESVTKLVNQMNKPFKQMHDTWNMETGQQEKKVTLYPNPIFAFHNIYSYIDHNVTSEEYLSQPPRNDGKDFADWMKFETNDWYNFNNREWGTKWDVAVSADNEHPDTYMEGPTPNGDNLVVYYNFNTAWSRPLPAMRKLSAQYLDLLFTLSYEEETGWGGEMEFLRGEIISESGYDTKCSECEAYDTMEYCEDCENEVCSTCNYNAEDVCEIHKEKTNV